MFIPLTVFTPKGQPTVIEMVGDWLNQLSPTDISTSLPAMTDFPNSTSNNIKFNFIRTIAPLFEYCAIFSLTEPAEQSIDQKVKQNFNIHGLTGKISRIKLYDSTLELYITIGEIPKSQNGSLFVDPMLLIELLFVGTENITEWRTFKKVEINLLPIIMIVGFLILLGALIWLK